MEDKLRAQSVFLGMCQLKAEALRYQHEEGALIKSTSPPRPVTAPQPPGKPLP